MKIKITIDTQIIIGQESKILSPLIQSFRESLKDFGQGDSDINVDATFTNARHPGKPKWETFKRPDAQSFMLSTRINGIVRWSDLNVIRHNQKFYYVDVCGLTFRKNWKSMLSLYDMVWSPFTESNPVVHEFVQRESDIVIKPYKIYLRSSLLSV